MSDPVERPDNAAELARRKYRLRQKILRGQAALPPDAAARLIGPDRAYHLYGRMKGKTE